MKISIIVERLEKDRKNLRSGCGSVWLERRLREAEAASSNLVTPTKAIGQMRDIGSVAFLCPKYVFIAYVFPV